MSAQDTFQGSNPFNYQAHHPARNAAAISPDNDNDLPFVTLGIYVGGDNSGTAGDIALITLGGQTVTFKAVPIGTLLPIRATRVKSTGTTATQLVALW